MSYLTRHPKDRGLFCVLNCPKHQKLFIKPRLSVRSMTPGISSVGHLVLSPVSSFENIQSFTRWQSNVLTRKEGMLFFIL